MKKSAAWLVAVVLGVSVLTAHAQEGELLEQKNEDAQEDRVSGGTGKTLDARDKDTTEQGRDGRNMEFSLPLLASYLPPPPTPYDFLRGSRHFSTIDVCDDAVCDQMVRQANSLARLKTLRRYIVNAMGTLDSLVTAVDAELVVAGEVMTRSLGNRCRAAHAVLAEVTKGPTDKDRLNGRSSAFIYGPDIANRF